MARRSVAGFRAAATRRSRDAEAAANIPTGLHALWNRVKAGIKGKTPDQRAERFQEYVHDHPGELAKALQDHADRRLSQMLAQPRKSMPRFLGRRSGSPRASSSGGSPMSDSSGLGDLSVPF